MSCGVALGLTLHDQLLALERAFLSPFPRESLPFLGLALGRRRRHRRGCFRVARLRSAAGAAVVALLLRLLLLPALRFARRGGGAVDIVVVADLGLGARVLGLLLPLAAAFSLLVPLHALAVRIGREFRFLPRSLFFGPLARQLARQGGHLVALLADFPPLLLTELLRSLALLFPSADVRFSQVSRFLQFRGVLVLVFALRLHRTLELAAHGVPAHVGALLDVVAWIRRILALGDVREALDGLVEPFARLDDVLERALGFGQDVEELGELDLDEGDVELEMDLLRGNGEGAVGVGEGGLHSGRGFFRFSFEEPDAAEAGEDLGV